MVIGDDEVESQAARGFGLGHSAHSRVDGNDEARAASICSFENRRLQAVSLAQTMRNMEIDRAAQHLDGGLEQDDGGGAVHVVIAVEQHRLAPRDCLFDAGDGSFMPSMRSGSWS